MNFLAHLWLSDQARLPLAGGILGDMLRGALPPDMPAPLADSVRLHRRVDAATDRHPLVQAARRRFGPSTRRYAGILLDVLYDHVLAREWAEYSSEPLSAFADRAAAAVAAEGRWFERSLHRAPRREGFSALLVSYRDESGIELALRRTAARLRRPEGLLDAMAGWHAHLPKLRRDLPELLVYLQKLGPPGPPKSSSPAGIPAAE